MSTNAIFALGDNYFAGAKRVFSARAEGLMAMFKRVAGGELAVYTTAARPTAAAGVDRAIWNSTLGAEEYSDGTRWVTIGINRGVCSAARLPIASQPADTNTATIDGHEFRFVAALGAAAAHTQVLIGANVAATRASLLNAINGVADATVVAGTGALGAVASLAADQPMAGVIRVRSALTRGGTATGAALAGALAETIAGGGNGPWDVTNLNAAGGRAEGPQQIAVGSVAITAAMVAAGAFTVELPFTPTAFVADTRVAGVLTDRNEAVAVSGNGLQITLAGGVAPNFQAGDVVSFVARA